MFCGFFKKKKKKKKSSTAVFCYVLRHFGYVLRHFFVVFNGIFFCGSYLFPLALLIPKREPHFFAAIAALCCLPETPEPAILVAFFCWYFPKPAFFLAPPPASRSV